MELKEQMLRAIEALPDDASVEDGIERALSDPQDRERHQPSGRRSACEPRGRPHPHGTIAEVKWTNQALDDLEAICLFIARDTPQVAAVFADRAFQVTDRLADHPALGRVVPEK